FHLLFQRKRSGIVLNHLAWRPQYPKTLRLGENRCHDQEERDGMLDRPLHSDSSILCGDTHRQPSREASETLSPLKFPAGCPMPRCTCETWESRNRLLLPFRHRQFNKTRLLRRMKDALRRLLIISRLSPKNVRHKCLWIPVVQREPA